MDLVAWGNVVLRKARTIARRIQRRVERLTRRSDLAGATDEFGPRHKAFKIKPWPELFCPANRPARIIGRLAGFLLAIGSLPG